MSVYRTIGPLVFYSCYNYEIKFDYKRKFLPGYSLPFKSQKASLSFSHLTALKEII